MLQNVFLIIGFLRSFIQRSSGRFFRIYHEESKKVTGSEERGTLLLCRVHKATLHPNKEAPTLLGQLAVLPKEGALALTTMVLSRRS